MTMTVEHNPDQYMIDLRKILSQGTKRIGLLIGAGAPVSLPQGDDGKALVPDVKRLTKDVLEKLKEGGEYGDAIENLQSDLDRDPNIEQVLSRVRQLSQVIGEEKVHGLNGQNYGTLANSICDEIGIRVAAKLPDGTNSYTQLASWIGGVARKHPIEIFTPNYDLLLEEAFERVRIPYFDGFTGAHYPFFDPSSISGDELPPRWARIWKIHGSLGWKIKNGMVVRTGCRNDSTLIYPDHLKYDQISRQPFSAFYERLRNFLLTPDSLLFCTGFSFSDAHITAVIEESLSSNTHTAVMAFQFNELKNESQAVNLALHRSNFSVYSPDGATIAGLQGQWKTGESPVEGWETIRRTFWRNESDSQSGEFLLGDFKYFTSYFLHSTVNALSENFETDDNSTNVSQVNGIEEPS